MKRLVIFSAMLILSAAAALAQSGPPSARFSNLFLTDVVRMTKAGMPDATIVAYVKARRAGIDSVSADDLIQLRRAGVGEPVIQYLAGVAALEEGRSGEARQRDVTYDSGNGMAYPVEPAYDGGYVYPYGYGYYPYDGGGYFSTSVVFIGGRLFRRHHFFHHRPFFHRRAFFGGHFAHHPFFPRRRFHRGLPPMRPSASLGSRMALAPTPGRVGPRSAGLRGQLPGGRGMHGSR
ncbi:MAG TPA: hypothetical protein VGK70_06030 [Thermoanaerobaculia bacterium]